MNSEHPTRAVLVTHHAKESVIAPVASEFGWTLEGLDADTDSLGTFTGAVARRGTPLETALAKARLARGRHDAPYAWASEGTISPYAGLLAVDHEVVVSEGPEQSVVCGRATSLEIVAVSLDIEPQWGAEEALTRILTLTGPDWGGHHLCVVPLADPRSARSAVGDVDALAGALSEHRAKDGPVRVQTDFRAHLCPSRRLVIAAAARDLLERLAARCPRCGARGFGEEGGVAGLPCAQCATPTDELRSRVWRCGRCAHEEHRDLDGAADPSRCPRCNP